MFNQNTNNFFRAKGTQPVLSEHGRQVANFFSPSECSHRSFISTHTFVFSNDTPHRLVMKFANLVLLFGCVFFSKRALENYSQQLGKTWETASCRHEPLTGKLYCLSSRTLRSTTQLAHISASQFPDRKFFKSCDMYISLIELIQETIRILFRPMAKSIL